MSLSIVSIGILVNAFVCAIITITSLALVFSLFKQEKKLTPTMQAYTWFWWFTSLVWGFSAIRYAMASLGYAGPWVSNIDILVQLSVFLGGPPLLYYLTLRVFNRPHLANIVSLISLALSSMSIWFILQPNGIKIIDVSYFSVEGTINAISFAIFSFQITLGLALLLFDLISRLRHWHQDHKQATLYTALYSAPMLLYIFLGSIDESKIITDWPLVVFRILYIASFLFVYLVIAQEKNTKDAYLIKTNYLTESYD